MQGQPAGDIELSSRCVRVQVADQPDHHLADLGRIGNPVERDHLPFRLGNQLR
jgi:hypothetical protein